MLPLSSDRWRELHHAYDTAEEVPRWLQDVGTDASDEAMTKIWDNLFHQQTVYPATVAAVPHLVSIARQSQGRHRLEIVLFVGDVAAHVGLGNNGASPLVVDADLQEAFELALHDAASLTEDLFGSFELPRYVAIDLLCATAALHGSPQLGLTLFGLNGEFATECPRCRAELYIHPRDDRLIVIPSDSSSKSATASRPDTLTTHVKKRDDTSYSEPVPELSKSNSLAWLMSLVEMAGDLESVSLLPYLYGDATCPLCHFEFHLIRRLVNPE